MLTNYPKWKENNHKTNERIDQSQDTLVIPYKQKKLVQTFL